MRERNERRIYGNRDLVAVARNARQKLDAVAEIGRVLDVFAREIADAVDLNIVDLRLETESERREDARLVGRIEAVDVERGIRFGVTETLGVLENGIKGKALVLHARKNIVARSVEDTVNRLDVVAGETLAHNADDRDAASDGRAEIDVDVVLRGRIENLFAVFGEKLLVGGDDALAVIERFENERLGDTRSADRLDDDLNGLVAHDALGVRRENTLFNLNAAIRNDVEIGDLFQYDINAKALGHNVTMLQKTVGDSSAHGPETDDTNSDLLHNLSSFCKISRKRLHSQP